MMDDIAIRVKDVTKLYKLYEKPSDRIKESLGLLRKKNYKEHYALKGLSFDIKKGECVGIIGTNGAGKSTILKIITGVLSPTTGDVEINGRISALLELGAGFNMQYTGIENIYLNGTMIGFSKEEIDEKLDSILEFADIGDFVYQPVKTYSSGMFVRLAFAVAINIDPEILIVDEALSVGDVFFQAKCYNKFEEFKSQGRTIVFVSHDMSSIVHYCDKTILLNKGTMLAEGPSQEMVDLYKKVMVGLADENGQPNIFADNKDGKKRWRDALSINPNVNEYGNGKANIIDFAVVDEKGLVNGTIIKGTTFTIKSKVQFNERVDNPIFTFTIKSKQGKDLTGTNTMYERKAVGLVEPGDVYVASFTQEMNLQGGDYLLSISCTGFVRGEFVVYHRLYDVLNITVVSSKDTVGVYDMNSIVEIEKIEE